jgi:ppGpp synthetase/RelA/SpoT-type nucleotidyltranferase
MQDIAGCRIVVADVLVQDPTVEALVGRFGHAKIFDRRQNPSHGYRAVHVIVLHENKSIEIQVRSVLQQMWAELSEKASDVMDPAIKYGGGPTEWNEILSKLSTGVADHEGNQTRFAAIKARARSLSNPQPQLADAMNSLEKGLANSQMTLQEITRAFAAEITKEGER